MSVLVRPVTTMRSPPLSNLNSYKKLQNINTKRTYGKLKGFGRVGFMVSITVSHVLGSFYVLIGTPLIVIRPSLGMENLTLFEG